MSKYLHVFNLSERWETFKQGNVHKVLPLVNAIETLSQNPTKDNINEVRKQEHVFSNEISELDKEDRAVLEDVLVRIMFQAYQHTDEKFTRWEFSLERAADKGFQEQFESLDRVVEESEEVMQEYASSGSSNEDYVAKQKEHLDELNKLWNKLLPQLKRRLSEFYVDFFTRQVQRKKGVIERHISHFQDNTFGEWLRAIREEKGWSLTHAAENTGVSSSYIHRIERGTRGVPSVKKLEQLAKGYNIPHNEMIIMASGDINTADKYIEDGAFLIDGGTATTKQKHAIAELVRMVTEGETEEAIGQIERIQNLLGK